MRIKSWIILIGILILFTLSAFSFFKGMKTEYNLYENKCVELNSTHVFNGAINVCAKTFEDKTIKYYNINLFNGKYFLEERE